MITIQEKRELQVKAYNKGLLVGLIVGGMTLLGITLLIANIWINANI